MILYFLLCIFLSFDAFGAGFVFGMKKVGLPLPSRLVIGGVSMLYSFISICIANTWASMVNPTLCRMSGGVILLVTGTALFLKEYLSKEQPCGDGIETVSTVKALCLGFILSIDLLGAGTGFLMSHGVANELCVPTAVIAGIIQFTSLNLGNLIGKKREQALYSNEKLRNISKYFIPVLLFVSGIVAMFI